MEWFFNQVIVPILVIGGLVFIHELGHFLVAKLCGVGVVRFAVGFGPALCSFRHKETIYQIGAIPLGGFVRMVGDMPDMITGAQISDPAVRADDDVEEVDEAEVNGVAQEEMTPELQAVLSDRNRWFIEKNFWQRSAIVFAGPLFNFIMAFALIAFVALLYGEGKLEEKAIIGSVMKGSPASVAGLEADDLVTSINGSAIATWQNLAETIHKGTGEEILFEIERDGVQQSIGIVPQEKELRLASGETKKAYVVGIGPKVNHSEVAFSRALKLGALWTWDHTKLTYEGLLGMISGKVSPNDLAGPLFILDMAGEQAEEGFDRLLRFTALLSVSLAVLNLLPIPVLDGGHLLFFIIEAIIGPISIRKKEYAQGIGMLLLLSLMAFAITNDITRDPSSLGGEYKWEEKEEGSSQSKPEITSGSEVSEAVQDTPELEGLEGGTEP